MSQRVPVADWAATAPWSGIQNIPSWIGPNGPVAGAVDLSNVGWIGVAPNRYPLWNGTRFVPVVISSAGTVIKSGQEPAFAVRRRPPGNPSGSFENIWARYEANVKLFGATGEGILIDSQAVSNAINAINTAGGGCLYFPAGSYNLSAAIPAITAPCLIRGDGVGVSLLAFGDDDGFSFSSTAEWVGATAFSVSDCYRCFVATGVRVAFWGISAECEHRIFELSECGGGWIQSGQFISTGTATAIYGDASDLEVSGLRLLGDGAWLDGIHLTAGSSNIVHDCSIANTLDYAVYLGTTVFDSRVTNILLRDIVGDPTVLDEGDNNYVNELFGLGGNTDTRFDSRKELISVFSWNPGSTGPGFGWYDDFNMPGLSLGDQVVPGIPVGLDPSVLVSARPLASDTLRLEIINFGTSGVDLDLADWRIRAFN